MDCGDDLAEHWDAAYAHGEVTRSWYQPEAVDSLRMFDRCGVTGDAGVVDVGGGASPLVDALLSRGHDDVTVLDVSAAGLDIARGRLGAMAERVRWLVTDLAWWCPSRTYQVWHDRAVFHFLTTPEARARYLQVLAEATEPGSIAVLATFAPDGPPQCSGLPVLRYSPAELSAAVGPAWLPVAEDRQPHTTPSGGVQPFTWVGLRRR